MLRIIIALSLVLLSVIGCSDKNSLGYTDDEIIAKVYSGYKFPAGFYTEDLDSGSIYYVNTLSIKPLNDRGDTWIELSTDNRDSAFNWSELSCLYSAYYRKYVSEKETEKYFEFRRVREENPTDIVLFRAHKASYIDRSMYDFFNPGAVIGQYKQKPLKLEQVKELIEYLIFVKGYNNSSYKVLESVCSENDTAFIHEITDLTINYGDWGLRDEIKVWDKHYYVNKASGNITLSKELVKTIQGRMN